jgi:hypothetical protein
MGKGIPIKTAKGANNKTTPMHFKRKGKGRKIFSNPSKKIR